MYKRILEGCISFIDAVSEGLMDGFQCACLIC